jgi:hypothetical protein
MPAYPTIPEGLDLIPTADGAIIRRVWLSWRTAPLALFAVVWDSFLVFWYWQALSHPQTGLMPILFPVMHVGVGIGITYYVLASLVNKTDVAVSPAGVAVSTYPLPWIDNRRLSADEITDVVVRTRNWNRNSTTHVVMYADRARREKKLVGGLSLPEQAGFIAEVVRRTLKIESRDQ